MRSLSDAESATSAGWSNWSAMPSSWEPENGRNVATAISLYTYALHSSQTTKLSPARGLPVLFCRGRAREDDCFIAPPPSLPLFSVFLCPPLALSVSASLAPPYHPTQSAILPSFLSSLFSPLIFAYHTSHQVSIGRRSAGRVPFFVLRSGGVRIHLACSRATIQGTLLFLFSSLKLPMNVISTKYDCKSRVSLFLFILYFYLKRRPVPGEMPVKVKTL